MTFIDLSALVSTAKSAVDLAKGASDTFGEKSKREQQQSLMELTKAMTEVYSRVLESQVATMKFNEEYEKLATENRQLKQQLHENEEVVYDGDLWYAKSDIDKRYPYCPTCKEVDGSLTHLQDHENGIWWCVTHQHSYYDSTYRPHRGRTKNVYHRYGNFDPRRM